MEKTRRYRPDHDGNHRPQYERNKKIIFATQQYCALCGRPVDFSLKHPDPMSATIDHIIPIGRGGHPSDIGNMQLAHFACNRSKGTKLRQEREPIRKSNRALGLSADWKNF